VQVQQGRVGWPPRVPATSPVPCRRTGTRTGAWPDARDPPRDVLPRGDTGRGEDGRDAGGSRGWPPTAGRPAFVLGDRRSPLGGGHGIL